MDRLYNYDEIIDLIKTKLNHKKEFYQRIITLKDYPDGKHYEGYIHDCFNEPQRIAERELDKFIEPKKNILVFWDDHSDYWIGIEDYFKKCGKRVVLKCSGKEFLEMKNDLPDDVYITDHSISFLVAYTHSYFDAKTRFCSVAKV